MASPYTELAGYVASAVFALYGAWKNHKLKKQKRENQLLKSELYGTKMQKLKELYDFQRFSVLEHEIRVLFKETPVTRFTIMFAMNGRIDFNYMTVVYDQHDYRMDVGMESSYDQIQIDQGYIRLLKEVERLGFVWLSAPFNIGSISHFMEMEEVKHCGWGYVLREALDDTDDLLVYLAISSEQDMRVIDKSKAELIIKGVMPEMADILKVPK
jgi:hypothetical protein